MIKLLTTIFSILLFTNLAFSINPCNCKGDDGIGGPCYKGIGGGAYDGIGGPAYAGIGGPCYTGIGEMLMTVLVAQDTKELEATLMMVLEVQQTMGLVDLVMQE